MCSFMLGGCCIRVVLHVNSFYETNGAWRGVELRYRLSAE